MSNKGTNSVAVLQLSCMQRGAAAAHQHNVL